MGVLIQHVAVCLPLSSRLRAGGSVRLVLRWKLSLLLLKTWESQGRSHHNSYSSVRKASMTLSITTNCQELVGGNSFASQHLGPRFWCGALLLLFHLISSGSWTSRIRASPNLGAIQWTSRPFPQVWSRTVLMEIASSTEARRAVRIWLVPLVLQFQKQQQYQFCVGGERVCVSTTYTPFLCSPQRRRAR